MASIKVTCPKCKHQFYMEDYEKKGCPNCGFVCCGPKSGSSGGCYLTTACVGAKGLPDNCTELQALRRLRDEFLMPTEFGRKAVAEYYVTAPAIVEAIQSREGAHAVWEGVYREIVEAASLVCFEPAGNGKSRSYGLESNPKRGEIHDCTTTMFHHRPEGYHP